MKTKLLPIIVLGSLTVAIHLAGFAAASVGAEKLRALGERDSAAEVAPDNAANLSARLHAQHAPRSSARS
jgi:hypothetical protein